MPIDLNQYTNTQQLPTPVNNNQAYDPAWALAAIQNLLPHLQSMENPNRGYAQAYANYAGTNPIPAGGITPEWASGLLQTVMPHIQANLRERPDRLISQAYKSFIGNSPIKYATPTPTTPTPTAPKTVDQAKVQLARQRAMDNAALNLRAQGIDPTPFLPLIQAEYDKRAATLTPDDDPFSFFSDDIADSVVQAELGQRQNQFMGQFNSQFGDAADATALPSSLLDDAINQILAEQRGGALQQLERGKARGIYNDVGYNAGLSALDNAMGIGRSELSSLGGSLIDKYLGNLNKIDDKAFAAYGAHPIGSSGFSLDPYITQRNDFINRTRTNAAGDLRGTLGGKNFFDFSKIAQGAGTAQGALNLRDTDVATALAERKRLNTVSRGLGSQGAF